MPPATKTIRPANEISDPHIRWLFQEIIAQNTTIDKISMISGVSRSVLQRAKTRSNLTLFDFKCAAEALGYEIMMVAKGENGASNENS